jgi:adenylate cyclase
VGVPDLCGPVPGNASSNDLAFAIYLPIALAAGLRWGLRRAPDIVRWLEGDWPPSAAVRAAVLRTPAHVMLIHAALWGAAVPLFAAINSGELAWTVAGTIVLGGVMTSTVAYLAAEQLMRPLAGRVLAATPLDRPELPGVRARLAIAWSMGTGVPLLGIVLAGDRVVVSLAVAGLAVGLVTLLLVAGSIGRPLTGLRAAFNRVREGDVATEVPVDDSSEVGLLQVGFNHMVAGLREREQLRDLFGRHVGPDVARQALEQGTQLGGELRDAAVLFVDIVGSTRLPEAHGPKEVVGLLNAFFEVVVDVVGRHGGWVNKFEGDAALCVFGVPAQVPDAAGSALAAARELRASLELPVGIGVAAGSVVAGNIGASERYEYTLIGAPVNAAARLTELSKERTGRPPLTSAETVARAARAEASAWVTADLVELRGMPAATRLALPAHTIDPGGSTSGRYSPG